MPAVPRTRLAPRSYECQDFIPRQSFFSAKQARGGGHVAAMPPLLLYCYVEARGRSERWRVIDAAASFVWCREREDSEESHSADAPMPAYAASLPRGGAIDLPRHIILSYSRKRSPPERARSARVRPGERHAANARYAPLF